MSKLENSKLIYKISENVKISNLEQISSRKDKIINKEGTLYLSNDGLILKDKNTYYSLNLKDIKHIDKNKKEKGINMYMKNNTNFLLSNHGSKEVYEKLSATRYFLLPYIN